MLYVLLTAHISTVNDCGGLANLFICQLEKDWLASLLNRLGLLWVPGLQITPRQYVGSLWAEHLVSGVGLPLTDAGSVNCDVLMLFNAENNPVFSMMQVWKANGLGLTLATEYVDGVPSLTAQMSKAKSVMNSIAFECWNRGIPIMADNSSADRIAHSPTVPDPGYGIAVPTLVKGKVVAVTVLAN